MNPHNFKKEELYKYKEAFNIFDLRQTGFLNNEDLPALLAVLHVSLSKKEIGALQTKYCGFRPKMNFRDFQALINEVREKEDSVQALVSSFENVQEELSPGIPVEHLKTILMKHGEPFSSEEMDLFLAEADPEKTGMVKYKQFSKLILK